MVFLLYLQGTMILVQFVQFDQIQADCGVYTSISEKFDDYRDNTIYCNIVGHNNNNNNHENLIPHPLQHSTLYF